MPIRPGMFRKARGLLHGLVGDPEVCGDPRRGHHRDRQLPCGDPAFPPKPCAGFLVGAHRPHHGTQHRWWHRITDQPAGDNLLSVLLLAIFYAGALARGADIQQHALGDRPLAATTSLQGVFRAWPFALWFFLGIEELPLAT